MVTTVIEHDAAVRESQDVLTALTDLLLQIASAADRLGRDAEGEELLGVRD